MTSRFEWMFRDEATAARRADRIRQIGGDVESVDVEELQVGEFKYLVRASLTDRQARRFTAGGRRIIG